MNQHDLIALTEIKKALSFQKKNKNNDSATHHGKNDTTREILRLPLLSRLLAASQTHASAPSISDLSLSATSNSSNNYDNVNYDDNGEAKPSLLLLHESKPKEQEKDEKDENQEQQQIDLNETVGRLEAVAAAHPAAEGMDILTTFLAPEVCDQISKYSPLKRKRCTTVFMNNHDAQQQHSTNHFNNNNNFFNYSSWDGLSWDTIELKKWLDGTGKSHNSTTGASKFSGTVDATSTSNSDEIATSSSKSRIKKMKRASDSLQLIEDTVEEYGYEHTENKSDNEQPQNKIEDVIDIENELNSRKRSFGDVTISNQDGSTTRNKKKKNNTIVESSLSTSVSSTSHSFFLKASSMAGDSQESASRKILIEITHLVLESLQLTKEQLTPSTINIQNNSDKDTAQHTSNINGRQDTVVANPKPESEEVVVDHGNVSSLLLNEGKGCGVALIIKSDSLLAEPSVSNSLSSFSANDVAAILPALMYHCPVFRYKQVANALCRAALPKTPEILVSMAANNPTSIPTLIRGCMDAFQQASIYTNTTTTDTSANKTTLLFSIHTPIMKTATKSIEKIAKLSKKEAFNVMNRLLEQRIMPETFLYLATEYHGKLAISVLLGDFLHWRNEIFSPKHSHNNNKMVDKDLSSSQTATQLRRKMNLRGQYITSINQSSSTIAISTQQQKSQHNEKSGNSICDTLPPTSNPLSAKKKQIRRIQKQFKFPTQTMTNVKPWILPTLFKDANLAANARKCIFQCLDSALPSSLSNNNNNNNEQVSWGQITLFLRAYSLLITHVGVGAGSSVGSGSRFVENSMICIAKYANLWTKLVDKCQGNKQQQQQLCTSSKGDSFYRAALCACIITCCRFPPISHAKQSFYMGGSAPTACFNCLSALLKPSISKCSNVFSARIAGFLSTECASELRNLIWKEMLGNNKESAENDASFHDYIPSNGSSIDNDAFLNTCYWACSKMGVNELHKISLRGIDEDMAICDIWAVIDVARRSRLQDSQINSMLSKILKDAKKSSELFDRDGVLLLIKESVSRLAQNIKGLAQLPVVLPRDLESLALRVQRVRNRNEDISNSMDLFRQFVLQLLYAFEFFDQVPNSPFICDPQILPLQDALLYIKNEIDYRDRTDRKNLLLYYSRLSILISKWCPEVKSPEDDSNEYEVDMPLSSRISLISTMPRLHLTLNMIRDSLCRCIHESNYDPSGCLAESLFLQGQAQFLTSAVDTVAISALLSSPKCPPPFYTYNNLCRDPLVALKCSINVWRMRGTRRIALSVLQRLLVASTRHIYKASPNEKTALELICVRDVLVVRCLVIAASSSFIIESNNSDRISTMNCQMVVAMVRSMIAKRRGLATMIVKQGIPERAVDWLVEFVPEVFLDARALTTCIFERNSLTSAERLATADAGVRIAIVHGARNETESIPLVYEALACLVNSFSLVIGPIGVSVSVLCEDGGQDVTQKCRRSTFRILNALQHITGRREALKNEVSMALSKIATLCKSETIMSGVVGPAAMKRKALLKDIWEKVSKTINTIDNTMQSI